MPTGLFRRRRRWRGPARATALKLRLVAAIAASLAVPALASTALAHPAALDPKAGLLPAPRPSVCVGGVLLCGAPGASPAAQPTPCVAGIVLCSALPLPSNPVTGPTKTPARTPGQPNPQPPARGTTPGSRVPGSGGGAPVLGGVALNVSLPAPPGVGLVPAPGGAVDGGMAPDSLATVLSLSMRDGMGSVRYHVWPWLLLAQLALWTGIAGVVRFRYRNRSSEARRR